METEGSCTRGEKEEISSASCESGDMSGIEVKEEVLSEWNEFSSQDSVEDTKDRKGGEECLNESVPPPFCFVGIKMEEPDYESDTSIANSETKGSVEESAEREQSLKEHSKVNDNSRSDIKVESEDDSESDLQANGSVTGDLNYKWSAKPPVVDRLSDMRGHSSSEFIRGIECQRFPILCVKQEEETPDKEVVDVNNSEPGILMAKQNVPLSLTQTNEGERNKSSLKTSAEHSREYRARERALKMSLSRKDPDASTHGWHTFTTEHVLPKVNVLNAADFELSPDSTSQWEEWTVFHPACCQAAFVSAANSCSDWETSPQTVHEAQADEVGNAICCPKSAAQCVREYGNKVKLENIAKILPISLREYRTRDKILEKIALASFPIQDTSVNSRLEQYKVYQYSCQPREARVQNAKSGSESGDKECVKEYSVGEKLSLIKKLTTFPKTSAERVREYRARQKLKMIKKVKKPPKSAAQRAREYRARKKLLKVKAVPSVPKEESSHVERRMSNEAAQ